MITLKDMFISDPEAKQARHNLKLYKAVFFSNVEEVRSSLSRGAQPNVQANQVSAYALAQACSKGNMEIIELLIDHGADININKNPPRSIQNVEVFNPGNPLISAIDAHQVDVIALLLEKGADPNTKTVDGHSAILCALNECNSPNNMIEAVDLLIRYGSDLKTTDVTPYSMLLHALCLPSEPLVRLFLEAGDKLNVLDYSYLGNSNPKSEMEARLIAMIEEFQLNKSAKQVLPADQSVIAKTSNRLRL